MMLLKKSLMMEQKSVYSDCTKNSFLMILLKKLYSDFTKKGLQ